MMEKNLSSPSYLGIEIGSTRIKAVSIDRDTLTKLSAGSFSWHSEFCEGIWTYDLDEVWKGIKEAIAGIKDPQAVTAAGISGMMHGYLAFDENWRLLTPFRTWQNTMTARAAEALSSLFEFNIPQRWCAAHLYEAILNEEPHISHIAHITTIAGYVHYMLTGINAVGIGEASGIFPIDSQALTYDRKMLDQFNAKLREHGFTKSAEELFPKVMIAGENAGYLTEQGAKLLGDRLKAGIPFAAPEGDAGTGMVATNSISYNTGNISAGTSIFAMVVLRDHLSKIYEEIDMVTTPDGKPVAMVHCNNCTGDINAWVNLIKETMALFGNDVSYDELYRVLFECSLNGKSNCDGIISCNYLSGEVITNLDAGIPLLLRRPDSKFSIENFMRSQIYSSLATLKLGMEIFDCENVKISRLTAHGGLFKTPGVAQKYMAAACNTNVICLDSASEGGPFGMALLVAYMSEKDSYSSLDEFLSNRAFSNIRGVTVSPEASDVEGFNRYILDYKKMLEAERKAYEHFHNRFFE